MHTSVWSKIISLKANGSDFDDLLMSLFNAYEESTNAEFKSYFVMLKNRYEDGTDITPDALMDKMANKYKILVQSKKYLHRDARDTQIFALQAQVNSLMERGKNTKNPKNSERKEKDKRNSKSKAKG